jgi:hypothetical protein
MKKYIELEIELVKIDTRDIMSASLGDERDPWGEDDFPAAE